MHARMAPTTGKDDLILSIVDVLREVGTNQVEERSWAGRSLDPERLLSLEQLHLGTRTFFNATCPP
jgi:hypothetical protein